MSDVCPRSGPCHQESGTVVRSPLIRKISSVSSFDSVVGQNIQAGSMLNRSIVLGGHPAFDCFISEELTVGQGVEFNKVTNGNNVLLGNSDSGVVNPAKHYITGRYTLHIKDAAISDEGQYQCSLNKNPTVEQDSGYLAVSDPPDSADLFWPDDRGWAILGLRQNLTCSSVNSRPPASFRWFRDNTDITHLSKNPAPAEDSDNYGDARSMLEVYPLMSEEGVMFKCLVDVPGGEGWFSLEKRLAFSSAAFVSDNLAVIGLIGVLMVAGHFYI